MKKILLATGLITSISPILSSNTVFANNQYESIELMQKSNVNSMNTTGKVINVSKNDVLNIRLNPNHTSNILGTIRNGQEMNIIGQASNGWYKVNYNGIEGFCSNKYIQIISTNNSISNIGFVKVNNNSRLNVRMSNSTNSSILFKLNNNTKVNILDKNFNGWYKISYNGKTGFVSSKYILESSSNVNNIVNSNNSTIDKSVIGKIGTVSASALNIRSGAGTNHSVISKTYKGNLVKIIDVSTNGWYKVELSSGLNGWCSSKYISNIRTGNLNTGSTNTQVNNNTQSNKVTSVINLAKAQIGKPYLWGAEGPNSFDCSGFTYYVFKNGANINLPRVSRQQATVGTYVSKSNLQPGDLVFFATSGGNTISHVGIYIGNGEMIHSPSSGKTVRIVSINSSYYSSRYVTARRVL